MDSKTDERIPFLEGWYFRPQKDVQGFHELCRPNGSVTSIVPSHIAQRLAAFFAAQAPASRTIDTPTRHRP